MDGVRAKIRDQPGDGAGSADGQADLRIGRTGERWEPVGGNEQNPVAARLELRS
jgi:hypothetical protein